MPQIESGFSRRGHSFEPQPRRLDPITWKPNDSLNEVFSDGRSLFPVL
jgi:hypothetical protein